MSHAPATSSRLTPGAAAIRSRRRRRIRMPASTPAAISSSHAAAANHQALPNQSPSAIVANVICGAVVR